MAKKGTRIKPPVAPVVLPSIEQVMQELDHPVTLPGKSIKPSVTSIMWDQETKADLGQKIISIRDVHGFPNASLSHRMESVWGVFTGVKTATDKAKSTITIGPADPEKDSTAITVNRTGTQNLVNFSLIIPLTKLGVRPTADRQWDIVAQEVELSDAPPVFVINVTERKSVPRNLKDEQEQMGAAEAAAGEAKQTGSAKGSSKKTSRAKASDLDEDEELFDEDLDI